MPEGTDEARLEALLFPAKTPPARFAEPDYFQIHQELKRKGVTLQLLWAEYVEIHGEKARRYSQFCHHYRQWRGRQRRSMRQVHRAGEKMFIDYCGPTVTKADRYSPTLNATYAEMAAHYQTAVLPARPYKPKDKAEAGALLVERWIPARPRHRTFFSLAELSHPIAQLLPDLNSRPFQGQTESRRSLFEAIDRPALRVLPSEPYVYAEWLKAKPGIDYHLDIDKRFYSVPHALVGQVLGIRLTDTAVEVMHKGQRVAVHPRHGKGRFSTLTEHMPKSHHAHRDWSPGRFLNWAEDIGPCTREVVQGQLNGRPHPEHGYRACLGLLQLSRRYSRVRLESACARTG